MKTDVCLPEFWVQVPPTPTANEPPYGSLLSRRTTKMRCVILIFQFQSSEFPHFNRKVTRVLRETRSSESSDGSREANHLTWCGGRWFS